MELINSFATWCLEYFSLVNEVASSTFFWSFFISLSCSSFSSSADVSTPDPEEDLGEIVELPSLGTGFSEPDPNNDFVFFDPVDGWSYPHPWWHHGLYDNDDEKNKYCGGFSVDHNSVQEEGLEGLILCGFDEGSLWQH